MRKPNSIIVLLYVFTFSSAGVTLRQNIGQSGLILWFLQVLLPQIIIQPFYTCFCYSLGVFRIFVLDQNFQFLFGNGGKSLSHTVEALLTDTLVSGQLYLRPPCLKPRFNSHTNSVCLHSCKRTFP